MSADFHNPQQDPGMERRLLLVFVLTFVVLLISQPLLMKYVKKPEPEKRPAATQPAPTPPPAAAPAPVAQPTAAAKPKRGAKKEAAPPPAVVKQAATEQETVVENDLYRITFTNRGAQIKSWILKKYDDERGHPLELVNQTAAAQYGYPMSLFTYDEGLRNKLAAPLYVANKTGTVRAPAELAFEYSDGDISVRKTFQFDHSYVVKVDSTVTQNGQPVRAYPAWPAGFGDQNSPSSYASARIDWYNGETNWHGGEKVNRDAIKNVSGGGTINGPFQYAGVVDQYFGAAFLPDNSASAAMVTFRHSVEVPKDLAKPEGEKMKVEVLGAAVGNTQGASSERIFVGPKALGVLESIKANAPAGQEARDLRGLVDFGFFSPIARPLFLWLRWQHKSVPNWGWAIIVLTVIINVVLFPLRLSSMKSALKMQKLQPQINAIKNKYSGKMRNLKPGDRVTKMELTQQQNQEIGALFKREGANPVGGCLPMLIQFPFLIAFYTMLGSAIELRHASWFWLRDLSSLDPLHILPILIILTTLAVQKMTPQAGMDPAQQKMMTFMMPVMLGVISWNLSSGLCLYWVVGNLVAIAQQFWMNNTHFGREMRAEAEKRARKKGVVTKT